MKKERTIPVYLTTGFLDGGKTTFLRMTMEQEYFNDGENTLLILCEEGEEEYSESFLKRTNTKMVVLEDGETLTSEKMEQWNREYKPERVLIEYNGMWSVKDVLAMQLPRYWQIYQIITVLDGENFKLYLNNIKSTAMEMLTYTDMVLFTRCVADSPLALYQRTVRSVNTGCELIFEDGNGNELESPEPDLPYSLDDPVIHISDENFGTFYIDLSEHRDRYEGKTLEFLVAVAREERIPDDVFVGGRQAMTCCENDIRFIGFIFMYPGAKNLKNGAWVKVTATMKWEFSKGYDAEGPVFYVKDLALTSRPKDELIYF